MLERLSRILNRYIFMLNSEWQELDELCRNLNEHNLYATFAEALYLAVLYNEECLIKELFKLEELVDQTPKITFRDPATEVSLTHMAAFRGNLDIVKLFWECNNKEIKSLQGKPGNKKTTLDKSSLLIYLASLSGNFSLVAYLRDRIDLNNIRDALMQLVIDNEILAAMLLIKNFAAIYELFVRLESLPKYDQSDKEKFAKILKLFASAETRNERGQTLLHVAVKNYYASSSSGRGPDNRIYKIVRMLLDAGADPSTHDDSRETSLSVAINKSQSCGTNAYKTTIPGLLLTRAKYIGNQDILLALSLLCKHFRDRLFTSFQSLLVVKNVSAILDIMGQNTFEIKLDPKVQYLAYKIVRKLMLSQTPVLSEAHNGEFLFLIQLLNSDLISDIDVFHAGRQMLHDAISYGRYFEQGIRVFGHIATKIPNITASTIDEILLSSQARRSVEHAVSMKKYTTTWSLLTDSLTDVQWEILGPILSNCTFTEKLDLTSCENVSEAFLYLLGNTKIKSFVLTDGQKEELKEVALESFALSLEDYKKSSIDDLKKLICLARRIKQITGEELPCCYISSLLCGGFAESNFFRSCIESRVEMLELLLSGDDNNFQEFLNSLRHVYRINAEAPSLTWVYNGASCLPRDDTRIDPKDSKKLSLVGYGVM